ncbi:MAG: helix-turn-helix domain-containing protein, partial [Candidatus Ranarchaeia archaeon]
MTEESGDTLGFNGKVLSELGLSGDEAVAYAILVGTGARTAEEVSIYTGRPVSEVKEALIRLSEKGYARRIAGVLDVYQSLNPQIVISSAAEEQLETELNRTISDINDMWKYGADLL